MITKNNSGLILISLLIIFSIALTGCLTEKDISKVTGSAISDGKDSPVIASKTEEDAETSPSIENAGSPISSAVIKSVTEELPPEKVVPQIDPEILRLASNAKEMMIYKYDAREHSLFRAITHFTISGNKIKIVLPEKDIYDRTKYYNTIYLDTKSKLALAFCEDRQRCQDLNKPFDISYEQSYRKTPRDWTLEILEADSAQIVGGETIYDRPALIVEFKKDGIVRRYSLDMYYGLATHILINTGSEDVEEHKYELTGINVGEDELIHQFMS